MLKNRKTLVPENFIPRDQYFEKLSTSLTKCSTALELVGCCCLVILLNVTCLLLLRYATIAAHDYDLKILPISMLPFALIQMICLTDVLGQQLARNRLDHVPRSVGGQVLCHFSALAVLALFLLTCSANQPESIGFATMLGVGLVLVGIALRLIAIISLQGRFVSAFESSDASENLIVQSGIYGWIRHPGELGLLFSLFGLVIVSSSFMATWLLVIVIIPLCVLRTSLEESHLRKTSDGSYEHYAGQVPGWIPAFCNPCKFGFFASLPLKLTPSPIVRDRE